VNSLATLTKEALASSAWRGGVKGLVAREMLDTQRLWRAMSSFSFSETKNNEEKVEGIEQTCI